MALLFYDGFDHYVTADRFTKWTSEVTAGGSGVISAPNGRHSSSSMRLTNGSYQQNGWLKVLPVVDPTTCIVGVGYRHTTAAPGRGGIISVLDAGTVQVSLCVNTDSTFSVLRADPQGGTVLGPASSVVTMPVNAFAYLELKVVIHPSAGSYDVRMNGVSILSATGLNTRNSANNSWNTVGLGHIGTASVGGFTYTRDYDDLYVLDGSGAAPYNTFLGDVRADALYPTGVGVVAATWTTGPTPALVNHQMVDETAPNSDTDYVQSDTIGQEETFACGDVPVPGSAVLAVQVLLSAKKTDAGPSLVAAVIKPSGGSSQVGTSQALGTGYGYASQIYTAIPGGGAWTEADFNAAEFGYKHV